MRRFDLWSVGYAFWNQDTKPNVMDQGVKDPVSFSQALKPMIHHCLYIYFILFYSVFVSGVIQISCGLVKLR